MDFNYHLIDKISWLLQTQLLWKLKKFKEEDWNWFTVRQKIFKPHLQTLTIPILLDEFLSEPKTKWYKTFKAVLSQLEKQLIKYYGPGSIERCILVKLPAHACISEHIDSGIFLERTKRIHLPLITNPDVLFCVGGEEKYMKPGELWEINNNNKLHGVKNNGSKDRIHMVLDFLPY